MAASTTVKVATLTGAAKDDAFSASSTGLTEDHLSANLNVLANDPGAARIYSLLQNTSGLTSTSQFPQVATATLASGATITINGDTVSYDASALHGSLQSYAEGETFTDTFYYTVRMANGALSTAKVTVSIAGANDAPTLAGVTPVSILDTANDDTPAAVTGTLAGADMDHGAVLTYGFADGVAFTTAADGKLVATNEYGTLTLDTHTGAYSFLADPDKIDSLAAGVNASASFDVKVTDEHNASSAAVTVGFNLIGANDTAVISGDTSGAVSEDGTLGANGALSVADRDAGQSVFQAASGLGGTYGDFTFNAATGAWTYTLHNDADNVQSLRGGQMVSDEITVKSLDGTDSKTIHVDVTGTNDIAVISGNAGGAVTEDGTLSAAGTLSVSDRDAGESGFQAAGGLNGAYGDFTFDAASGAWTYALRNGDANVQALASGQTVSDELVVTSLDGSASQTIHVDIGGADEPVVRVDPPPPSPETPPPPPPPVVDPVTDYMVNNGLSFVNNRATFTDFDSNDRILYSGNFTPTGIGTADTDGNSTLDSSVATFDFQHGRDVTTVEVVLIGYTDLTAAQIVHA